MPSPNVPSVTVKALAELMPLPAYDQVRILNDQKYPRDAPQRFRTPFYQTALRGIRQYYRSGNNTAVLAAARAAADQAALEARRTHNRRVIDQFQGSNQARRRLRPQTSPRFSTMFNGVEVRLNFDLVAEEDAVLRHIFYNMRNVSIDPEAARRTLELASWVLERVDAELSLRQLEYVDIVSGVARRIPSVRPSTITRAEANLRLIRTLWPTI